MSALIPNKPSASQAAETPRGIGDGRPAQKKGSGLKSVVTFVLAAGADSIQFAFPPLWIPVSIVVTVIFFVLWGWKWEILCALIPELAPVAGILPGWTAVAIFLKVKYGSED